MAELKQRVTSEVAKVVVGQDDVVEQLLAALLVGGHVLLEGVPGVAKTLVANATSRALGLHFRRVQFTPDMLPSDLTGTMTLRGGELAFRPGPVFTNVLLADEINRTPPKTQAALLEAMQERQVTVDGAAAPLPDPFLVIATQNPIEYEGTYPLPEAQLDRFLSKLDVGYPSGDQSARSCDLPRHGRRSGDARRRSQPVVAGDELLAARPIVDAVALSDEVADYVVAIVRGTRSSRASSSAPARGRPCTCWRPRRRVAWLDGRSFVTPDDVAGSRRPVLRHRLLLRPEAELERYRPDDAVRAALQAVPVPR